VAFPGWAVRAVLRSVDREPLDDQEGSNVFETYWTTRRGVEAMDNSYRLLDFTVYGRQGMWEDSPTGWPQRFKGKQISVSMNSPTAQWSRLKAGCSDDLGTGRR
jgi:predicted dithiol-disulfide oxidoreductase (DUF899 family)